MNKLDKTQEGQTLLDDGNNYTPLEDPMARAKSLKKIVEELHQGSFIDEITVKWLSQTPNPPRIPVFYTLTKIHKPTPVGRPIVAGNDGPTERISSFVDSLLQPIAKSQKSYLKDTTDFVNFIERRNLPEDASLVSLDVADAILYTNISQDTGRGSKHSMQSIPDFLRGKHPIPTQTLRRILKLILHESSFEFNGKNYLQSADEMDSILHNFFCSDEWPPKFLQTDNGTEFINEVVNSLCKSLDVRMIHGRPYHPESQGQVENLNKRVKKKLAKLLCQRPADEQAKLWPYLLPLVVKEINTTWHHTIEDVPFRVFKGRSTAEFSYPVDEEFFEDGSDEDDGEFGDNDPLSECEAYSRLSDLSSDNVHQTVEDGLEDQVRSFADRLEIGCNLARIREKTRLQAPEATERMIATNTRHRFRVLEKRIREFSVEEVVIFKDPETVPAKTKKMPKILSRQETYWAS